MAIPANVAKLVFQGELGSGFDFWNIVIHGQMLEAPSHAALQTLAEQGLLSWNSKMLGAGINGHFGNSTTFDKCTATALDVTNHALDIAEATQPGASPHGSGGPPLPSEVALVVSLVTGLPGRSYRGRSYLAGIAQTDAGDDGRVSIGSPLIFANAFLALLQDIDTSYDAAFPAVGFTPGVLSVVKGVCTPIVSTRVGNVFDVQRRRRNGTPEVYTPST